MHKLTTSAAMLLTATPLTAQPATHPELEIDAYLPALIAGLKRTLPDAYSIRDLTVCSPHEVSYKDGRSVSWAIQFALNAKNESGGYAGLTSWGATFKNGRASMVFPSGIAGKGGLDGVINRAIMKQIAKCRPIPQATVQNLLETTPAL